LGRLDWICDANNKHFNLGEKMEKKKIIFNDVEYEYDDISDRGKHLHGEISDISPKVEEAEKKFKEAQEIYSQLTSTYQYLLSELVKELGISNDKQNHDNTETTGS
jgi:DNA anti-recombination protein RmuC